jgi:hypothetical protein
MKILLTCLVGLGLMAGTTAMAAGGNDDKNSAAPATSSATASSAAPAAPASPAEERMEEELQELRDLLVLQGKQLQDENNQLKEQFKEQQQKVQSLEEQLSIAKVGRENLAAPEPLAVAASPTIGPSPNAAAAATSVQASEGTDTSKADDWKKIYDGGFYVKTEDGNFSLHVNGLFQPRFTDFDPRRSATALGAPATNVEDFDIFLGRLALSGSAFDPSIKYFVQFQGSTSSNTNGTNFIDWFAQKEFSNALSIQMGRSWTPYSLENLDSPGQYLFADFSSAEYAFALSRAVGFEALGQAGRLGYALMIANSVPALDAAGQENFNNKVAFIGHVQYDVLAPYGYQESDPKGAPKPELTIWSSVGYNPVAADSSFSNQTVGDRTVNATTTIGFRAKYFTLQNTGFYRNTLRTGFANFNSWGYAEQGGYYIVPGKVEFTARVSGVNWGAPDFLGVTPGADTNTWYSGPNFPFHRITENSVGVNYYLHGHNAKFQWDYSYLTGNTFADKNFNANRVWLQAQIMF